MSGVIPSTGFGAVRARDYFRLRLFGTQKSHSWGMVEEDFPLWWYSLSDIVIGELRSQYTVDCRAGGH